MTRSPAGQSGTPEFRSSVNPPFPVAAGCGTRVGATVGAVVGTATAVGATVGAAVGTAVATAVGAAVGAGVAGTAMTSFTTVA